MVLASLAVCWQLCRVTARSAARYPHHQLCLGWSFEPSHPRHPLGLAGLGAWSRVLEAPTMAAQQGKQLSGSHQSVVVWCQCYSAMGTAALFTPRLYPVLGCQPVEAVPALHTHSEGSLLPSPCRIAGAARDGTISSAGQHLCLCRPLWCHCTSQHISWWVNNTQPEPQCVLSAQTICSHCCTQCPSSLL